MGLYVAHVGKSRNTYKILIRKPHGKRPFESFIWKDSIKIYSRQVDYSDENWIEVALDRV